MEEIMFVYMEYDQELVSQLVSMGLVDSTSQSGDCPHPMTMVFEGEIFKEDTGSLNLIQEGRFGVFKIYNTHYKKDFVQDVLNYYND